MIQQPISFTFIVLAYNHEPFIIEHLESIKYLISAYAEKSVVDIIINDDCSKDNTVNLIRDWLNMNPSLFRNVVTIVNEKNIGTCASVINALSKVSTEHLKLTAGDDVYSFENIFEYSALPKDVAILSGLPLSLVDENLFLSKNDVYNIIASQEIYASQPLINRFTMLANNNAPNIFYSKDVLMSNEVYSFLSEFKVVEDWPIQVAIAKNYPTLKFKLIDKVFVYYRRTSGSTYLIANSSFMADKIKLFDYLIVTSDSFFQKAILKSRRFCFKIGSRLVNKLCNLGFYIFVISLVRNLKSIYCRIKSFDPAIEKHILHYRKIKAISKKFRKDKPFDKSK